MLHSFINDVLNINCLSGILVQTNDWLISEISNHLCLYKKFDSHVARPLPCPIYANIFSCLVYNNV